VVVSHDRVDLLRRCLESLEHSEAREKLQLILVDNGSHDGSQRLDGEFPGVQFIRLPKNFGLTKALNIGWRAADAEYVFFLHEDTEVRPETVARLADALDANPDAAAVCPLLVDEQDRPAPQLGEFPPDGEFVPAAAAGESPVPVVYTSGAALMTRVFLIKAIRQIDERYGQFGSDADLAAQFRKSSRKVLLLPALHVVHHGGRKSDALQRADRLLGRAVFLEKYRGIIAGVQARLAAVFGPLLKFDLGVVRYTISGQKIDGTEV
jgi:GT2 family glycosyltransferase